MCTDYNTDMKIKAHLKFQSMMFSYLTTLMEVYQQNFY